MVELIVKGVDLSLGRKKGDVWVVVFDDEFDEVFDDDDDEDEEGQESVIDSTEGQSVIVLGERSRCVDVGVA